MGKRAKIALVVVGMFLLIFPFFRQLYRYPSVTVEHFIGGDGPAPTLCIQTEVGPTYRSVVYYDGKMERNAELDKDTEDTGSYNYRGHYLMSQKEAEGYTDGFLLENGNYLFVRSTTSGGGLKADIFSPSLELISERTMSAEGMEFENSEESYWGYRSYMIGGKIYCLVDKDPVAGNGYYYLVYDVEKDKVDRLDLITVKDRLPDDNWRVSDWRIYEEEDK